MSRGEERDRGTEIDRAGVADVQEVYLSEQKLSVVI